MFTTPLGAVPPTSAQSAMIASGRRGPPTISAETQLIPAPGANLAKDKPIHRLSREEIESAADRAKVWDQRRKIATYRTAVANGTATPAVHAYVARLDAAEGLLKRTV